MESLCHESLDTPQSEMPMQMPLSLPSYPQSVCSSLCVKRRALCQRPRSYLEFCIRLMQSRCIQNYSRVLEPSCGRICANKVSDACQKRAIDEQWPLSGLRRKESE